jgi:hypothetical protein
MNTGLRFAIAASATLAVSSAWATENEPVHNHHYRHTHHVAHPTPASAAERPGETVENAPPPATNQMFKPYFQPGEGDNDGMSRDPDDCMKGCIGGNPQ